MIPKVWLCLEVLCYMTYFIFNKFNFTQHTVICHLSKYILSFFAHLCRVALVCLDLRVLLEVVVLLVCLDREEREVSLAHQDLL